MADPNFNLVAADAAALDALVEAGMDLRKVSPEHMERATRVARMLGLAGTPPAPASAEDHRTLIDVTLARVMRSGSSPAEPVLNWEDEEAMEAWLMGAGVGARDPRATRVARHEAMARLVTGSGRASIRETRGATIDRTFEACMARGGETIRIERFRGLRVRMADLVSVAAVLMIGAAVLWPVLSGVRDQSRRFACADNLRDVASGMGLYAGANRDELPVVTASLGGGKWWEVGSPDARSNSANLFHLARTGFAKVEDLACPGNPAACSRIDDPKARDWRSLDEVSYSYRIMFGPERPQWSGSQRHEATRKPATDARVVILTDRSPVVLRAARGQAVNPWENSPNHGRHGQKVMFSDGSAAWYTTPELDNRDNIWLPLPLERAIGQVTGREVRLEGNEFPASARDAFVGP